MHEHGLDLKSILAFALSRPLIILLCLLVVIGSGAIAFKKLNIEAYPNSVPVILEITADATSLSVEEMERYYTIPLEVDLYQASGIVNIRSNSSFGLFNSLPYSLLALAGLPFVGFVSSACR